jgi:hypothetical protein
MRLAGGLALGAGADPRAALIVGLAEAPHIHAAEGVEHDGWRLPFALLLLAPLVLVLGICVISQLAGVGTQNSQQAESLPA